MRKWWGVVIHRRQARRMREETKERQRDIGDIPQRVRERAQHVFPLSHSFRTAECSRALMLARRDVRRYYTLLYRVPRGKGVGRKGIWFISFFNNSLLFSSSLSVAATFWSIALDMSTTIHFYLRSDAGGRWDSSPFPLPSSHQRSLVLLLIRPAVCDFISPRRNHCRYLPSMVSVCRTAENRLDKGKAVWWVRQREDTGIRMWQWRHRVDFAIKILSCSVDFMFGRYDASLFSRYMKNVRTLKIKAMKGKIFL